MNIKWKNSVERFHEAATGKKIGQKTKINSVLHAVEGLQLLGSLWTHDLFSLY